MQLYARCIKTATKTHAMNPAPQAASSPVVELRQYSLHPGQRDNLIALFELEFIESQEACGMTLMGLYRDQDDADRFVWLRGFKGMTDRVQALGDFYGGSVWRAHRDAANATMIDSDNVMLLTPATARSGILLSGCTRATKGSADIPPGLVMAHICSLARPANAALIDQFQRQLSPLLQTAGAMILGSYVTEHATNTFQRLPVRTGENLFVWFSLFDSITAHTQHLQALARNPEWAQARAAWHAHLQQAEQVLRLVPTPRSSVHAEFPPKA
jgi:hypothetical protein